MSLRIYQGTAGRLFWSESTSPGTVRNLASGKWVLFDDTPDTPPPAPDGFDAAVADRMANGPLTKAQLANLLPLWKASTAVSANELRMAPDGQPIKRVASGTTRASYDATEQAAWTLPLRAAYALTVAATVTASGTLAVGKHNPVDASGGAKSMTLPTGAVEGASIGVEKLDTSTNAVTVTGNIRGAAGQSISLPWAHETLLLRADSSGSWWPVAGHKTKSTLDAAYDVRLAVAANATANATLAAETHTPVDASAGARTMTLPSSPLPGARIVVEKVDASANVVVVSGSIRGSAGTVILVGQFETVTLVADSTGSWHPGSGYRTKGWLDANYGPKFTLNLKKDFGAKGDGITDDSAAFAAAALAVKATAHTITSVGPTDTRPLQYDQNVQALIEIPPGDYLVTDPGSVLGDEGMTSKAMGLTWRGAGQFVTNIIFKPATASAMLANDYWLGLTFQDLSFMSATPGSTWMQSYTTHNAQRYTFQNVRWAGWKYGIDLQGNNSNDSFTWFNCDSSQTETGGAFLFVGATNTSDQFLSFHFYSQKHWGTSAPLIDAAKGGHFYVENLDASNWGVDLTGPGYLFYLRGANHSQGVCMFKANGVRVEAKNNNAGLVWGEWEQGNVKFDAVDWSSQAGTFTYNDLIHIDYQGVATGGAIYSFRNSTLAGNVKVKFATNDWAAQHVIEFDDCTWLQKASPSDVVVYDTTGNANNLVLPPVDFRNCRGTAGNIYSAGGGTVWNARIGYRGQPLQTLTPRVVSVRHLYGLTKDGDQPKFQLPVGALITGIEVLAPAGAVTESDGGTWTLATTDATPVTVASVTVPGAMSAGFDVTTNLTVPFECSTTAKATLTITSSGVAQRNPSGLLLIKGYW